MQRIFGALRMLLRSSKESARPQPIKLLVETLEDRVVPAGDFRDVIGLTTAQGLYPYRGQGYTVAILDTGIDYNHPDLGGGFGAGKRVIAGHDFINNDADPMDDNGHGTHLAGIIGGANPGMLGVAPNVNFVALKVLDATNSGNWTAVENALQWVISHRSEYNIVGVNLSLGSGTYTSNPYTFLEDEFSALKSQGVFTSVASGNRFFTYNSQPGVGYPAISANVVSVGATWVGDVGSSTSSTGAIDYTTATDRITAYTQRGSPLSLLAPGAWITSTTLGGGTKAMGGTSMAAAVVTGSSVLLHEAYDKTGKAALANQDNLLALMKSTGVTVNDGDNENDNVINTGLNFKRLDLKAALDTVGQINSPPTLNPIANQTLQVGKTIFVPLSASDPENNPITFSYKQIYLPALAYQLDQLHGFAFTGNYATNSRGANEKWILDKNSLSYCILPNGELRRWAGSMTETLKPANLIATFNAAYYADPTKVWNAPYAGMPPTVFTLSGTTLSIRSPAYWLGTYSVEVTASDGQYSVKRAFDVTVVAAANTPPVLAPIANRTIGHAQRPLVLPLSATDANNDPLTYSATIVPGASPAPPVTLSFVGSQLTIMPAASFVGTFTVQAKVSDGQATDTKTFTVTVNNAAPVLATLADRTVSHGQDTVVTLSATDADLDPLTYSARVIPVNGSTPAINVSVVGNQLTLHPTQPLIGTFTIEATVSDGAASAIRTFLLTLTNAGPTMSDIASVSFATAVTSTNVTVSAADSDNDPLSYQAVALKPSAVAYQLDQQYGFKQSNAVDHLNLQGKNEKWVIGTGNLWYAIMPDGKIYRWSRTMTETMTPANLIATVDTAFYATPRLLWNANPAVTPAISFTWVGNKVTIQRPASLTGVFFIEITVSDGWLTSKKTLQITLN